jgi:Fe-S-cluster containining protein
MTYITKTGFPKVPEIPLFYNWHSKAQSRNKLYSAFLKNTSPKKILAHLPSLHEEAFSLISCLDCAACCSNYSPRFKPPDTKRISKWLRNKPGDFADEYLTIDDDKDSVLKILPCPFLAEKNECRIYDVRPGDCSRFPYTDEDIFYKKPAITLINVTFCPIAYYVMEKLIEAVDKK